MITVTQMQEFVRTMPWPADAPRPVVKSAILPDATCAVLLCENIKRGYTDIIKWHHPTPEGALRQALSKWLEFHKLQSPDLVDSLQRLMN